MLLFFNTLQYITVLKGILAIILWEGHKEVTGFVTRISLFNYSHTVRQR